RRICLSALCLYSHQLRGRAAEDRCALVVAEAGRVEDVVDGGRGPGEGVVRAEDDLARADLGDQVPQCFRREDDRVVVKLLQVLCWLLADRRALAWEGDAAGIGAGRVGGQIAAAVGGEDLEAGEAVQGA